MNFQFPNIQFPNKSQISKLQTRLEIELVASKAKNVILSVAKNLLISPREILHFVQDDSGEMDTTRYQFIVKFGAWKFQFFSYPKKNFGYTPPLKFGLLQMCLSVRIRTMLQEFRRYLPSSIGAAQRRSKFSAGYTSIEIVVVIAIVVLVGAATLFSFSGLGERGAINRSAQEFALAIRSAQNKALGVSRVGTVLPSAVGVRLVDGASSYFLFSDADGDKKYTAADVKIGKDEVFIRNISIDDLTGYPSGSPEAVATAHIIFTTPEASAVLTDGAGSSIGNQLDIKLKTPSQGFTKTITVRVSGQISIK